MYSKYEKYIMMSHHISPRHRQMPREKRAAQFAPFAALSGYDSAVCETARHTDVKGVLSEDWIEELNAKLHNIQENIMAHPMVRITFFEPDKLKSGGAYVTIKGNVHNIDEFSKTININGCIIPINDIYTILKI